MTSNMFFCVCEVWFVYTETSLYNMGGNSKDPNRFKKKQFTKDWKTRKNLSESNDRTYKDFDLLNGKRPRWPAVTVAPAVQSLGFQTATVKEVWLDPKNIPIKHRTWGSMTGRLGNNLTRQPVAGDEFFSRFWNKQFCWAKIAKGSTQTVSHTIHYHPWDWYIHLCNYMNSWFFMVN